MGAVAGSVVPVAGTFLGGLTGGIAGALAGGYYATKGAKTLADKLADDDAKQLLPIVHRELKALADEYLLTDAEQQRLGQYVRKTVTPRWLRRMYKTSRKMKNEPAGTTYVRNQLEPAFERLIRARPRVSLPKPDQMDSNVSELILPQV